ncbi:ABC transporter permease [Rhodococcus opacus]|uniref:ABC transporter permease n=1 Tax=Rhodococcus opacus TaxID=37919 RepID=UPI001C449967|nr:ABC transporter permease [Rhodococcus opacus]MBV6756687.1 ABC transporter permease [Rhodococcus opacus]
MSTDTLNQTVATPIGRARPRKATRRRKSEVNPVAVRGTQIAIVVAALALWEFAAQQLWIDSFFVGQPSAIAESLWGWITDGSLLRNAWVTFSEAASGFVIAVVLAIPIGIFLARNKFWGSVAKTFVDLANSTPRFALAPLFVLFFGLGPAPKVVLVVSVVFFLMLINTIAGVESIDDNLLRMGRLLNASKFQTFRKLILPATGEWLIAAMRMSAPYALAAAVVGEMISSTEGLGYLVVKYAGLLETSKVFAAVFCLALCGWTLNAIATGLAQRTPWMKARQSTGGGRPT